MRQPLRTFGIRSGSTLALALAVLAAPAAVRAQSVHHDFEDGTTQGWGPRGSAVLTVSPEAAATGLNSLKITGRTASWNGPSLNVMPTIVRDRLYQLRVSVRLTTGQAADTLRMTIERRVVGETSDRFDQVAASPNNGVTDAGWVTLQGSYLLATDVSKLILYVESTGATTEFYIDDFHLDEVVPDQTGFSCDFETDQNGGLYCYTAQGGGDRNWAGRGSAVLANVTEQAHGGTRSLRVTGRTAVWNGPALNILGKMTRGFRYRATVWVKLATGEPDTNVRVSIERRLAGATNFTTVIPNTMVTANEWIRLSALFTMPADVDFLSFYVETATAATASFYIDDVSLAFAPPLPIQTDIPSLKDVLADHFPIGGAVEVGEIASARHADLMRKHFDTITAGNAMKFGPIHPAEATYSFGGADTIANFARANAIQMRGHTLVWHQQNPDWLFRDAGGVDLTPTPENKALMLARLEAHIRAVVPRYADVVTTWDVVNEVIDPAQPDGMRRSRWFELTGTDYIDHAFQVAREEAGPDVRLCINDYSTTDPVKRQFLLQLVQGMLDRGVPVDCIGHQMHINVQNPSVAAIRATLEASAALGVENQVTEMDISVYTDSTSRYQVVPEEILVQQAYRYRDIFAEYRRLAGTLGSVTLWGLGDDSTWLKNFPIARLDLPLLFDEDLQAKHSYWAVVDPQRLPVLNQRTNAVNGAVTVGAFDEVGWATSAAVAFGGEDSIPATFQARWDEHHLYVRVSVDDPTRSARDRVEVFVDENNGKTPAYEADDAAHVFRRGRQGDDPLFRVRERVGGYDLEAAIPITRALAAGDEVGFDVRVTDGRRQTVAAWNDFTLAQDTDPSKFGTLVLVGESRIEKVRRGTPVVDAVVDRVWGGATEIETATWVLGTSGSTARVKLLWDQGHLYVLAHVADTLLSTASANPWEEDSIEVFLDQNNGKTSSYQADDGQFRVNYENTQSFGGSAGPGRITSATRVVPGGYVVEAAIAFDAIAPVPGTLIGFDFQVNNDELGNGVRSSVVTWNDPTGQSFQNTSRLGVLQLVRLRARGSGR